jgi:uncharacterized protein YyaL (SSP411 family)
LLRKPLPVFFYLVIFRCRLTRRGSLHAGGIVQESSGNGTVTLKKDGYFFSWSSKIPPAKTNPGKLSYFDQLMNKLSSQTSPYLLQHADNPVHWYPWGEEALDKAREENKPILLSVGYSACHWCHVMAHESFENEDTAKMMNDLFVNIKVDREERPDLDKIYQTAHSMLTNRPGGWPLTVFLTPDEHMPIFAGTYFPDTPRHGMPAFTQIMQHISEIHRTRQEDIARQNTSIREAYARMAAPDDSTITLNSLPLDVARNQIEQQFDSKDGGFSAEPKFPHPAIIDRALQHWAHSCRNNNADPRILHTAIFSLEKMASGGLFDHLGGGFCRYSTDAKWMIPHFEKMLYDNGPLLCLNTQAWCITKDKLYLDTATETADWVIREMQSPEGGYYSALDADSEGEEGKFYTWTEKQVTDHLDADNYPLFRRRFGLDRPANFEGQWHLHAYLDYHQLSEEFGADPETLRADLRHSRDVLFNVRENRVHPGLDDKILTSWNGLMIKAMSQAGRILGRGDYIESAQRAAFFIKDTLWQNQRLLAAHKDGKSHLNAYLDDYAFLLDALLEILQANWDNTIYAWTLEVADALISLFEDNGTGGFFFTSHDHEQLIQRTKTCNDEAIPSGSGVAVLALNRLGYLSGKNQYIAAAERALKAAWQSINQAPVSHCTFVSALHDFLDPPNILIIRSQQGDHPQWAKVVENRYLPSTLVFAIPADITLHESLAGKVAGGSSRAYPCNGYQCQPPLTSLNQLNAFIENNSYRILE